MSDKQKIKKFAPKSKEQNEKEIKELTDKAMEEIKNYNKSPESILEYAKFMSKFHNYSPLNISLIQSQFNGAQAVASFPDWKKHSFSVQRGEKGINILFYAPYTKFKDEKNEWKQLKLATKEQKVKIKNKELEIKKFAHYKQGTVFDVSQTNAKAEDLPEIFPNKVWNFEITGENSIKELQNGIDTISKDLNIDIKDMKTLGEELGASRGVYRQFKNGIDDIVLNTRNTETQNISVALHELAHKDLHNKSRIDEIPQEKIELGISKSAIKEFQAEMVSYIVCQNYGMDTSKEAIPYISTWTKNTQEIDSKILADVMRDVRDTSKKFIELMDKSILKEREKRLENAQTKPKKSKSDLER